MSSLRRRLLAAGALAVAAGLVATGFQLSSGPDRTPAAGAPAAQSVDAGQLSQVLVPVAHYPEGTTLEQFPIQEAVSKGLLTPPDEIAIKPAACAGFLEAIVGDLSRVSGWVQRGTDPQLRTIDAVAATVEGGADLNKLRDHVAGCESGTVHIDKLGLVGTIEITEIDAPGFTSDDTFAFTQQVSFEEDTPETAFLEAAGSSAQVYTTVGSTLLVACEFQPVEAFETILQMLENLVNAT